MTARATELVGRNRFEPAFRTLKQADLSRCQVKTSRHESWNCPTLPAQDPAFCFVACLSCLRLMANLENSQSQVGDKASVIHCPKYPSRNSLVPVSSRPISFSWPTYPPRTATRVCQSVARRRATRPRVFGQGTAL
jgi:hypothetical protein